MANRTCSRISRIGERREALLVTITVHIVKISPIHEDFASHLDKRSISEPSGATELQGDRLNGTDVGGDIFASVTVTAGRTRSEQAVLIDKLYGNPVELRLHNIMHVGSDTEGALDPRVKFKQLAIVKNIRQGEHWNGMLHLAELLQRLSAYSLGGGVVGDKLRISLFQLFKAPEEPVVLEIRDFWPVQNVIQIIVVSDLFAKVFYVANHFCRYRFGHFRHSISTILRSAGLVQNTP